MNKDEFQDAVAQLFDNQAATRLINLSGSGLVSFGYRYKRERVRLELGKLCGRILDVGCNVGTFEYFLSHLSNRDEGDADYVILGVDVSKESVWEAAHSESLKGLYCVADGASLPYANDSIDAVVCLEMLEHAPDKAKVLSEIARVLKPGGKLVLTTPNGDCQILQLQNWFKKIKAWLLARSYVDKDRYTNKNELLALLQTTQFRTSARFFFFWLRPYVAILLSGRRVGIFPPLATERMLLWIQRLCLKFEEKGCVPKFLHRILYWTLFVVAVKPIC